jgi:hypothetical protein
MLPRPQALSTGAQDHGDEADDDDDCDDNGDE